MPNQQTEEVTPAASFRIVHFTVQELGSHSLVGICKSPFPLSFGSYLSFLNPDNRQSIDFRDRLGGPRVVNMWHENLVHLFDEQGLTKVRAVVFGTAPEWLAFIEDDNVPKDYLNDSLCITGSYGKYLKAVEAYSGLLLM
jgi:hypothetical protein